MNPFGRMLHSARDWLGSWGSGDKALAALFGRGPTVAGVDITEETALNISAVWACVQLIAGNLSSLPLIHYRKLGNGDRSRATDTRLYRLLHDSPNEETTSATFLETLQMHVLLWGNAFAEIGYDRGGSVRSLYPIEPWRVSAVRPHGLGGELRYRIAQRDGSDAVLRPDEILHVPGLSPNGVWGYSVIRKARESMGLTMATEQFGSSFFGKGSTFGGILTHPNVMTKENEERLRASLEQRHQGVDRAHQFVILQGGMTFTPLGIPGRDAQFLQQRQFQLSEIARWFGVPPHLIGDVEKSTSWGSGIQQQTIGFLQFTLRRWLVKWERELNRKLISPLERNLQFIEFNVDGLERGDQDSRYKAYAVGIQWGFMTRNEVRAMENLPKIEGGDTPLVPGNMTTEEKLTAPEPKPAAPPTAAADKDLDVDDDDAPDRSAQIAEDIRLLMDIGREVLAKQDASQRQVALIPTALPPAVDLTPVLDRIRDDLAAIPPPAPPTDLTPIVERLDAVAAEHRALAERVALLAPSLRDVILGALRKEAKFEGDRARKAAQSPEKLRAWMETFYATREESAVPHLLPAVVLHFQLVGRADNAEGEIRRIIREWVADSRAALEILLGDPENLEANVKAITEQWETERPRAVADALLREVIAHGG